MKEFKIDKCVLGLVSTNCYIVYKELPEGEDQGDRKALRPGVVIDPGDHAPFILNRCRELNIRPEAVLLTHGHFDHILAAEDIRRAFHIPIMAGEKEMALLEEPGFNLSGSFGEEMSLAADRWLRDGEVISLMGSRWKVMATPGHTAGCVCFYIEEEGVLFSGDTLFRESVGRTDLPTASSMDLFESITRTLFSLPEDTDVYPGHGQETTIGHEKKHNVICRGRR